MAYLKHRTIAELEAGLVEIYRSPQDAGVLDMIVRRPDVGQREVLNQGELNRVEGLVGDNWKHRNSSRTPDGTPHPDMQLNIMNSRAISIFAQNRNQWRLAGDQLFVDLDLSENNLPAWTKLSIGSAVIVVTDQPHTGCNKFVTRFGIDAMRLVNSSLGRKLNLRGINARIVQPGSIRVGDLVRKISQ